MAAWIGGGMQSFHGQYSGAALSAFVRGLQRSEALIRQILRAHGLAAIADDQWYDLNTARSIYATVQREVGERSLHAVGVQMIEAAPFPPGLDDICAVLASLDHAYHMNVRGPDIGRITSEIEDEGAALVTFATPFPCALSRGIVHGCCKKFMPDALVEHAAGGCVERGDPSCSFHVTW